MTVKPPLSGFSIDELLPSMADLNEIVSGSTPPEKPKAPDQKPAISADTDKHDIESLDEDFEFAR